MKLLFLSIGDIPSINHHEIYPDLLREFKKHGDEVYIVCCRERREGRKTELIEEKGSYLLKVCVGNIKQVNLLEKGISTMLIPFQYQRAIRSHFPNVKFDLIMYSTPPITLVNVINSLRKRYHSITYLLLKDIFPQNAVDLGILSTSGFKGLIYRYFRRKETQLYKISDYIGCMSPANVNYLLTHNTFLDKDKVEVCPNTMEINDLDFDNDSCDIIRMKYGIPLESKVFIYGGNLGKPQDVPYIIECLKSVSDIESAFFLIVGNGTDYARIKHYVDSSEQKNVKLIQWLPKEDYENVVRASDIGLIFLDYSFTVPNFPSRLLPYMSARIPILACTDETTDLREVIQDGGFGWWIPSNDTNKFRETVSKILKEDLDIKGNKAYHYLVKHYSSQVSYDIIFSSISKIQKSLRVGKESENDKESL